MRLIFLGSGEFGLPTLQHLCTTHEVVAVISQPDRPAGRNRQLTPTPIANWAVKKNLVTHKVENANEPAFVAKLAELHADAAVVIAFGQKLSPELLAALGKLAVNLHASLLPKYRGAAPINWAMLKMEATTGNSVISLSQRMDGGLIYAQNTTEIHPTETAGELHDRLSLMGPELIARVLEQFASNTLQGQPQDETLATRAPKLSKEDAWVDFGADAFAVTARIHGLTPWPGVRVHWHRTGIEKPQELFIRRAAAQPDTSCFPNKKNLPTPGTILEGNRVAVRDGSIKLLELQLPGGKSLSIDQFVRGNPLVVGEMLRKISNDFTK